MWMLPAWSLFCLPFILKNSMLHWRTSIQWWNLVVYSSSGTTVCTTWLRFALDPETNWGRTSMCVRMERGMMRILLPASFLTNKLCNLDHTSLQSKNCRIWLQEPVLRSPNVTTSIVAQSTRKRTWTSRASSFKENSQRSLLPRDYCGFINISQVMPRPYTTTCFLVPFTVKHWKSNNEVEFQYFRLTWCPQFAYLDSYDDKFQIWKTCMLGLILHLFMS